MLCASSKFEWCGVEEVGSRSFSYVKKDTKSKCRMVVFFFILKTYSPLPIVQNSYDSTLEFRRWKCHAQCSALPEEDWTGLTIHSCWKITWEFKDSDGYINILFSYTYDNFPGNVGVKFPVMHFLYVCLCVEVMCALQKLWWILPTRPRYDWQLLQLSITKITFYCTKYLVVYTIIISEHGVTSHFLRLVNVYNILFFLLCLSSYNQSKLFTNTTWS
jgi:hypothetical protein